MRADNFLSEIGVMRIKPSIKSELAFFDRNRANHE